MKIAKLHKEKSKGLYGKEKPSLNGELVAGAVLRCEEPRSKMEPQTE